MGLFEKSKRLVITLTNKTAKRESARMVYLSAEANELKLGGIIRRLQNNQGIVIVLEGPEKQLKQFIAFVRASFGKVEQIQYRFEKDRQEFLTTEVQY